MDFEIWLSREEITAMCRAKTKAKQLRFLLDNGIKHYKDCDGWPVVSRAVAEGITSKSELGMLAKEWKPNKAA